MPPALMPATLGVQMFTLRKFSQTEKDLDAALGRIKGIGYRAIQTAAFGDIPAATVAKLCQKHDLDIAGSHVSWERFLTDLPSVIEEHRLWNCTHTAVGFIPPKTYLSLAGLQQFLVELDKVTNALTAAGIDFSYHHHSHEFLHFDNKPWLRHLLERASSAALKLELDTHWVVAGGADPAAWINAYGNRMPLLHLKDFRINREFKREFAAIGDGNLNWQAILGAAAQHPISYYFVEQDSCYGEDEFDCLQRSYQFLTQFGLS